MNEHIRKIGQLVSNINARRPLKVEDIPQGLTFQKILVTNLLILIRNNFITKQPQLLLLEDLTSLVSSLVPFDHLRALLARFDRQGFIKECKRTEESLYQELIDKVYGIYPEQTLSSPAIRQSKIFAFDRQKVGEAARVGNKDYKMSRANVDSFYAEKATKAQKEMLAVLLCDIPALQKQMLLDDPCYHWYCLWLFFYSWTIGCVLKQSSPSLPQIRKMVQDNRIKFVSQEQQIQLLIALLFNYIINSFFLKESQASDLPQIQRLCFKALQRQQCKWTDIVIILLLKDCLQLRQMNKQVQQCEQYMQRLQRKIDQDVQLKDQVKNIIISYMLLDEKLETFLINRKMPFWEYGLNQATNQKMAEVYLNFYLNNPQNQKRVFQYLRPSYLNSKFLNNPETWIQQEWALTFLDLCESPSQRFLQNIEKAIYGVDKENLRNSLYSFAKQWRLFLETDSQEFALNDRIKRYENLMTFNFDEDPAFRKVCRFPQDFGDKFIETFVKHSKLLKQAKQQSKETLNYMFQADFAKNLMLSSNKKWDQYWQSSIDLLLENEGLLKDLLKVENENSCILDALE